MAVRGGRAEGERPIRLARHRSRVAPSAREGVGRPEVKGLLVEPVIRPGVQALPGK